MDNKKRINLLRILVFLGIIIVIGVIVTVYSFPKEASTTVIIGGADGPTTIYISSDYGIYSLVFTLLVIVIDLIILGIKKIMDYKRKKEINLKYYIIFVLLFNILIIFLLPGIMIHVLIINVTIILIYIVNILLKKSKEKKNI